MPPRVCYIATEYFGWGRYGGIDKATRDMASGVAERGFEVHAVVPRGRNQRRVEIVDGVTVHCYPIHTYPFTGRLYREIDADVYLLGGAKLGDALGHELCGGRRSHSHGVKPPNLGGLEEGPTILSREEEDIQPIYPAKRRGRGEAVRRYVLPSMLHKR